MKYKSFESKPYAVSAVYAYFIEFSNTFLIHNQNLIELVVKPAQKSREKDSLYLESL